MRLPRKINRKRAVANLKLSIFSYAQVVPLASIRMKLAAYYHRRDPPMVDRINNPDLQDRLDFVGLDAEQRLSLAKIQPTIRSVIGAALDVFYGKASKHPHTRKFFSSDAHIAHAKDRQTKHWDIIASGKYQGDYVEGVTTVGRVHARIGLEPRWYIGGYAIILEGIIRGVVGGELKGFLHGRKAKKVSDDLTAVVKAALIDMDYAISVYLDALAEERSRLEEQRAKERLEQERAQKRRRPRRHISAAAWTRGRVSSWIPDAGSPRVAEGAAVARHHRPLSASR